MTAIPRTSNGGSFDHFDANAPFCIDDDATTYNGGTDELEVVIGPGRARWDDGAELELTADENTYTLASPAASTTYYVYLDHNGGSPDIAIITAAPPAGLDLTYLGRVVTDGATAVASTDDTRSLLPLAVPRFVTEAGEDRMFLGGEANDWIGYDPITERGRLVIGNADALVWRSDGVDVTGTLTADDVDVDSLNLNGSTVSSSGDLTLDAAGGDLRLEEGGGLRGLYDASLNAWRFWNAGTEVMRLDGGDVMVVSGGDLDMGGGSIVDLDNIVGGAGTGFLTISHDNLVEFDIDGNGGFAFDASPGVAQMQVAGNGNQRLQFDDVDNEWEVFVNGGAVLTLGASGVVAPNVYGQDFAGGEQVYVEPSGLLHIDSSTRRLKDNIRPIHDAEPSILEVEPLRYTKPDTDGQPVQRIGIMAEDVAALFPEAAIHDDDGQVHNYDTRAVLALLLREVRALAGLA